MAPSPLSASDAGPAFADVAALAQRLAQRATRAHTVMEVCGGQTHSIVRWGLDQLLPPDLRLIHGPGCPVCVTPAATIDAAITLARTPGVILCTYGDMARVPGSRPGVDLLEARAAGGDVRLLTSPLAALDLARTVPDHHVVFFAVGFETTAPATALLARQALALGLPNLSLLTAHVRVAPAMEAILADPSTAVEAFLAAGHVCSVLGTAELEALVERFQVPVVVTGFEPEDVMAGLCQALELLEAGRAEVANAYSRVVRPRGNPAARALLDAVFMPVDQPWRGLGPLAIGGGDAPEAVGPLGIARQEHHFGVGRRRGRHRGFGGGSRRGGHGVAGGCAGPGQAVAGRRRAAAERIELAEPTKGSLGWGHDASPRCCANFRNESSGRQGGSGWLCQRMVTGVIPFDF